MNRFTIYCTEEQTRKALALGAPIILESEYYTPTENDIKLDSPIPCDSYTCGYHYAKCPTASQMIGWLEEQGLCIDSEGSWDGRVTMWVWDNTKREHVYTSNTNSRQEATLAVIDAALDYLIINKK